MMLPRNDFPLGNSEDSPVIKGELHRCNISKSSLAKWKKTRRGVEWREVEEGWYGFEGGELETKLWGVLRVDGENKAPFPSEPALIMRSCWGMEGYISAVNVFNMSVRRSAVTSASLASSHHIISLLMPVISMFCILFESFLTSVYRLMPERKWGLLDKIINCSMCAFLLLYLPVFSYAVCMSTCKRCCVCVSQHIQLCNK